VAGGKITAGIPVSQGGRRERMKVGLTHKSSRVRGGHQFLIMIQIGIGSLLP